MSTLAGPHLAGPGGPSRIDRRTSLLLAYLALEGAQPRARMATLLWPDSTDATGRANLRQLIRRANAAAETTLLLPGDPVALSPALAVDVALLRNASDAEAAASIGSFLAGIELDDVHEQLAAWVDAVRASTDAARVEACHREAARLEGDGDIAAAIDHLRRALWIDAVAERTYRELMRLHYLEGDRGAAQAVFNRCRVALAERLGVEPAPETTALADEIRRSQVRRKQAASLLPLSIQRPPRLIGREREWAAMKEAWDQGKGIVLGGPPGIGKTHLMQEFLSCHARPLYFRGRPGDRSVPYGTHARTYRELIRAIGGGDALPAWARRELARILPELGDSPGPLADDAARLRFWSAKVEAHRVAHAHGYDALGFDDLQFVDPASITAGEYVLQQLGADSATPVRTVHCYRIGEVPPDMVQALREWAAAGIILHLELQALDAAAMQELVRSLGIPAIDELAPVLATYSGGVPLFLLETIKHVLETGGRVGETMSLPGRTADILGARLGRLSPAALELARVLAICREQFSIELAAAVVDAEVGLLAEAWTELSDARIVRDATFSHDLLAEAVVAETPAPVRALLHRRVAQFLEGSGASPGQITPHWVAAGEPERAERTSRAAEGAARGAMLQDEATSYFRTVHQSSH